MVTWNTWLAFLSLAAAAATPGQWDPPSLLPTGQYAAPMSCRVEAETETAFVLGLSRERPLPSEAVGSGRLVSEDLVAPLCREGVTGLSFESTAGMQVYRDPATRRFTEPPPEAHVPVPKVAEARGRPLVQKAQPGGGARVDFVGGFATAMRVRQGPDGRLVADCTHGGHSSPVAETEQPTPTGGDVR